MAAKKRSASLSSKPKRKQSRQKGNRAERQVAVLLEQWWGQYEPGCRFVRTPGSGGWGGKTNAEVRGEFSASGDLMTTAKHFEWSVEVKRREAWSMKTLVKGGKSPIWGWWQQAQTSAREMNKRPMLIFRESRGEWRVILDRFDPLMCAVIEAMREVTSWSRMELMSVNYGDRLPAMVRLSELTTYLPDAAGNWKPVSEEGPICAGVRKGDRDGDES